MERPSSVDPDDGWEECLEVLGEAEAGEILPAPGGRGGTGSRKEGGTPPQVPRGTLAGRLARGTLAGGMEEKEPIPRSWRTPGGGSPASSRGSVQDVPVLPPLPPLPGVPAPPPPPGPDAVRDIARRLATLVRAARRLEQAGRRRQEEAERSVREARDLLAEARALRESVRETVLLLGKLLRNLRR